MPKGVSNNITNISGTIRNNTKMYGRVINGQQFVSTVKKGWTDNPTDEQKVQRVRWRAYQLCWPLIWQWLKGDRSMQEYYPNDEFYKIRDALTTDFRLSNDDNVVEDGDFRDYLRFDYIHKDLYQGVQGFSKQNPPDGGYIQWMFQRMQDGETVYRNEKYKSLKMLSKAFYWYDIIYKLAPKSRPSNYENWKGKFQFLGFDWYEFTPAGYDQMVKDLTPRGMFLKKDSADEDDTPSPPAPDDGGGGGTTPDDGGGGGSTNPPDDGGGTTPPPAEPSTSRPGDANSMNFSYRAIDTGVDFNGKRLWISDRYAGAVSPEALGTFFTKAQYLNEDPATAYFGQGWQLIDNDITNAINSASASLNPQQKGDRVVWQGKEEITLMNSGYMSDGSLTGQGNPYFWGAPMSSSMFQCRLNPGLEYNYVTRSSIQSQVRAVRLEDSSGDGSEGSEGGDSGDAVNRTINEYLERADWLKGDGGHYVSSYRPIAGSNTNKAPDVTIKAKLRVSQFASNVGIVTNICGSSIVSDGVRFRKSNLAIRAKSAYTFEVGYFAAVANVAEDLKFYGEYSLDDVLTIEATAQAMTINGKSYTLENENNNTLSLVDLIVLYAGSSNGGRSYGGELAYIEYWSKGVCNSQLIPCKVTKELPASMANTATAQPVGAVGLWDTKNEKFMTSSAANTWQAIND